jgi:hypothetical protein
MSTASQFLKSLYAPRNLPPKDLVTQILTPTEANSLDLALRQDAVRYFYSSAVTLASGIGLLNRQHGTWATVHFYYSAFYSMRSCLAENATCLFYYSDKPFFLRALSTQCPKSMKGTSHDIVLREYCNAFPNDPVVTTNIDFEPALNWLKKRREEANYRIEKFPDPSWASYLKILETYKTRRLIEQYVTDKSYDWRFDPDHALLALPVDLLQRTKDRLLLAGLTITFEQAEKQFLRESTADPTGPLRVFNDLIGLV